MSVSEDSVADDECFNALAHNAHTSNDDTVKSLLMANIAIVNL